MTVLQSHLLNKKKNLCFGQGVGLFVLNVITFLVLFHVYVSFNGSREPVMNLDDIIWYFSLLLSLFYLKCLLCRSKNRDSLS